MRDVYKEAASLARDNKNFVTATVVNTKGSTPQKPGAALLVREDGSTVGTLGGGCVEGDIWFAAKEALRERSGPQYQDYFLNEDIAARDGLVCGGSMYFYIEPVLDPISFTSLADEIANAYDGGPALAIATVINSKRLDRGNRLILRSDGSTEGSLGDLKLDEQIKDVGRSVTPMGKSERVNTRDGDEIFVVGYTAPATVLLVGGGHVNLSVARAAHALGFAIMVTDDRREFANKERFPMAENIDVAPYDKGVKSFPITENTAIIVATRGHRYDDWALRAAAETSAGYVGLIGSKRKTLMIYESLLKSGMEPSRIKSIHAPIGLDLGGRSPEEIAVSIVAELLAFRYGHSGRAMKLSDAQIDRLTTKVLNKSSGEL